MLNLQIAQDHAAWVQMAAEFISDRATEILNARPRFVMALSGGDTPRPVYEALPAHWQRRGLGWERVQILWSDERCVPPDHDLSNYRMVRKSLLEKVSIPESNIHPMRCGGDHAGAAASYETELRNLFPDRQWPAIDLALLGLGTDGHTASLFPGDAVLTEQQRWVAVGIPKNSDLERLTLTIPALNAAGTVAFLVSGSNKAEIIRSIDEGNDDTPRYPAQHIKPLSGSITWLLDRNAASDL